MEWAALVECLQPTLAGVVARCALRWGSVTPELIEDLTQEAFLKLCRDGFAILQHVLGQPEEMVLGFMKVTAANLVHDRFRAERSAKRHPPAGFLTVELLDDVFGETSSAAAVERELLLSEIDRFLAPSLPSPAAERDRTVFWLHHRHGMTAKAISQLPPIGLSEKGVESLLFRLNARVREKMVDRKGISARESYG